MLGSPSALELHFNSKFVCLLDEDADVVTDQLAKHLIDHRDGRLAAHIVSELRLDHAERALNVAALMIVRQKILAAKAEVMEHLLP